MERKRFAEEQIIGALREQKAEARDAYPILKHGVSGNDGNGVLDNGVGLI